MDSLLGNANVEMANNGNKACTRKGYSQRIFTIAASHFNIVVVFVPLCNNK